MQERGGGGSILLQYDDTDGAAAFSAGAPFDLTVGGIESAIGAEVVSVTGNWTGLFTVESTSGTSTGAFVFEEPTATQQISYVDFVDFAGAADFTSVTGLSLLIEGDGGALTLASVQAIPEPSSVMFLAFSSLGLVGLRRRKA